MRCQICKKCAECCWAALFDKSDVQQIAGSKQSLDGSRLDAVTSRACSYHALQISEEQARELLDALLAVQREVEGQLSDLSSIPIDTYFLGTTGSNTVTGAAPSSVKIEGTSYSFADKSKDVVVLSASGKVRLLIWCILVNA